MLRIITCLMLVTALTGCLRAPTIEPREYYALSPSLSVIHGEPLDKTLGIRPLSVAKPFTTSMAYMAPGNKLTYRVNQEWAEKPGDTLTRALIDALAASGRFKDVGNAAEMSRPDYILTGEIRNFVENRGTDPASAEIEVRIEVREAMGDRLFWADTLNFSETLEGSAATELSNAMSRAIEKLVESAAMGITSAEP